MRVCAPSGRLYQQRASEEASARTVLHAGRTLPDQGMMAATASRPGGRLPAGQGAADLVVAACRRAHRAVPRHPHRVLRRLALPANARPRPRFLHPLSLISCISRQHRRPPPACFCATAHACIDSMVGPSWLLSRCGHHLGVCRAEPSPQCGHAQGFFVSPAALDLLAPQCSSVRLRRMITRPWAMTWACIHTVAQGVAPSGDRARPRRKLEEPGPFWGRQYLFWSGQRPLTLIYEVFSPKLQRYLGPIKRE